MTSEICAPTTDSILAPMALTMGEPSGVGGELTLKAWQHYAKNTQNLCFFAIDCPDRLSRIAQHLDLDVPLKIIKTPEEARECFNQYLPVMPLSLQEEPLFGQLNSKNGQAVLSSIETAVSLIRTGHVSALITNPIHKAALYDVGFKYPGHTEYLAALAEQDTPSIMMLSSSELRVVPVTIHESLRNAIDLLDASKIIHTAEIVHHALKNDFGIMAPRLAISGLNPHAGESGKMGLEDQEIVAPAIEALQKSGIDAFGPLPADTMFHKEARENYDVAICMYHDQALIPIKTLDFHGGVNITLGLPFIRTSPDHGTALDIAGQGIANPTSLINALQMAHDMAQPKTDKA